MIGGGTISPIFSAPLSFWKAISDDLVAIGEHWAAAVAGIDRGVDGDREKKPLRVRVALHLGCETRHPR